MSDCSSSSRKWNCLQLHIMLVCCIHKRMYYVCDRLWLLQFAAALLPSLSWSWHDHIPNKKVAIHCASLVYLLAAAVQYRAKPPWRRQGELSSRAPLSACSRKRLARSTLISNKLSKLISVRKDRSIPFRSVASFCFALSYFWCSFSLNSIEHVTIHVLTLFTGWLIADRTRTSAGPVPSPGPTEESIPSHDRYDSMSFFNPNVKAVT